MANPAPVTREDIASSEPPAPLTNPTHPPSMAIAAAGTRKDAPPFELPDIPKEFGKDDGEFYRRYDALAEELDKNMVDKLKEQLDAHLIFAGLFAGVNSTFLALTLPLLSADPADDTNALLRENNAILLQLAMSRNDSFPIAQSLPSETFSASGRLLKVNILFSISLTFALMSCLFAVLGRQWLFDYRSRNGGESDEQRRVRISRYLGMRRWRLEWLLGDMIPIVLQIGLILFGISLTIYLSTVHPTLTKVFGAFMGAGLGFLLWTAIFTIWDPSCPFQTPLSRVLTLLTRPAFKVTSILINMVILPSLVLILSLLLGIIGTPMLWTIYAVYGLGVLTTRGRLVLRAQIRVLHPIIMRSRLFIVIFLRAFDRVGQRRQLSLNDVTPPAEWEGEAVRRVICNSNDSATLTACITNILAIQNHDVLGKLAENRQFCVSLIRSCRTAYLDVLRLHGRDQTELATAVTWRYRAAMAHVAVSGAPGLLIASARGWFDFGDEPGLTIPPDLIKKSSPVLINGYLGYVALLSTVDLEAISILGQTVTTEFEGLIDSSWKRISIMTACLILSCGTRPRYMNDICIAFKGEPSTVLQNLVWLTRGCTDPGCSVCSTSRKYLPEIFKSIRMAAIDSSGQSTIKIDLIAQFLRRSELILRGNMCPAGFSPVARGLRRDLINALRSMCEENMDTDHRNNASGTEVEMDGAWFRDLRGGRMSASSEDSADMRNATISDLMSSAKMPLSLSDAVFWLLCLFRDLANPGWLTISSNDDDVELMNLFSPVLEELDKLPQGDRFKVQVRRLHREFEKFTSIVNSVAQSRDGGPSTGTDGVTGARDDD